MSKRRLTKQQKTRIQQRRQATDHMSDESLGPLGEEQEGVVISHFRTQADVEPSSGGSLVRCHLRANLGPIVAGDRVRWQAGEDSGVVNSVYPRETELVRPDSYGKLKLIAANVERMLITIAPEPEPHGNLIDRYLLLAACFGLQPALVLNKSDLCESKTTSPTGALALLHFYRSLGYQTFQISAKQQTTLSPLKEWLKNGTSIFVGQSGVGKSSIVQCLLPSEQIKIGKLSEQAKKGRHTTTHARLYHFNFGGHCIDSPGIRDLGLWHLEPDQVSLGFPEFAPFIEQCRFRNCSHQHEPGCALLEALQKNKVSRKRFDSYQHILATLCDVDVQPLGSR